MSEWVWSRVTCLKKDRKVFEDMGYIQPEDEGDPWIELSCEQANYGNASELRQLRGQGIPFLSYHGGSQPGMFEAHLYASDGEVVIEQMSDDSERPTVTVMDNGHVREHELRAARKYLKVERAAKKLLGIKKKVKE
jgi:nitrogen regulatory protein PII-like uncharacterized protein